MEEGTFKRLVSELSLKERNDLLSKLSSQSGISAEPLYIAEQNDAPFDVNTSFLQMPWYQRFWYFFLGLFKSVSPVKVYEDKLIAKTGAAINSKSPGLFDYRETLLLPEFHRELSGLKDNARFFYSALDLSFNKDKGAFFAFLASLEMGDIHRRLTEETDPLGLAKEFPKSPNSELHQMATKNMEGIFSSISSSERNMMYYNARSLYCLKELSSFLFDRLLMAFTFEPSAQGYVCSAKLIKDQLINLGNILFSFSQSPSISIFESLFVFALQEQMGNIEFDLEAETKLMLSRAETALASIRNFNKTVPLVKILRCVTRDLNFRPRVISGGEDWFVVYRDYWKKEIDDRFVQFARERKRSSLTDSFRRFLGGASLGSSPDLLTDANPDGIYVSGTLGLSFLSAFYSSVFINDINNVLRIILLDGEFYKRENRTDFTESYNELMKIDENVKKFNAKLAASGDYGRRHSLAKAEIASLPVKRRKIQLVSQEASRESLEICAGNQRALRIMIDVLDGIIRKESGAKYDTLANLTSLPPVKGKTFMEAVSLAKIKLEEACRLLEEVHNLEAGK